jgi:hypothetical protein
MSFQNILDHDEQQCPFKEGKRSGETDNSGVEVQSTRRGRVRSEITEENLGMKGGLDHGWKEKKR